MSAKSKLDSIEILVSQALIDMKISHEELNVIIREKQKYERMKENVRNVSERSSTEKQENMRLNSMNSRKKRVCDWLKSIEHLRHQYCVCVCVCVFVTWVKSAKKHTKNVKLKLLTREDTLE